MFLRQRAAAQHSLAISLRIAVRATLHFAFASVNVERRAISIENRAGIAAAFTTRHVHIVVVGAVLAHVLNPCAAVCAELFDVVYDCKSLQDFTKLFCGVWCQGDAYPLLVINGQADAAAVLNLDNAIDCFHGSL
jgi:hypothetical protein